jgi:hypothetical protein
VLLVHEIERSVVVAEHGRRDAARHLAVIADSLEERGASAARI